MVAVWEALWTRNFPCTWQVDYVWQYCRCPVAERHRLDDNHYLLTDTRCCSVNYWYLWPPWLARTLKYKHRKQEVVKVVTVKWWGGGFICGSDVLERSSYGVAWSSCWCFSGDSDGISGILWWALVVLVKCYRMFVMWYRTGNRKCYKFPIYSGTGFFTVSFLFFSS